MPRRAGPAVVAALLCFGAASGDDLGQLATTFAANRDALREYAWSSSTELVLDGETLGTRVYEVSQGPEGELLRRQAPGESASRRTRKEERKRRQYEERLESLRALIDSYVHPDPRTARQMYVEASVWQGDARTEGMTRIQARNVLRQGDSVNLWLDSLTRLPGKLEIVTSSGGEPVLVRAEFERLDAGPFYPALLVVETEIKEKKLVSTTRNYDFHARDGRSP